MPRNHKTDLFQKRQYEWLAEFVKNLRVPDQHKDGTPLDIDLDVQSWLAVQLANALSGSNPGFDRSRFLDACKPNRGYGPDIDISMEES